MSHRRYAVNLSILFCEVPLLQRPAAGDMAGGDRGLVSWPARSRELRDNLDVALDIGERPRPTDPSTTPRCCFWWSNSPAVDRTSRPDLLHVADRG